MTLDNSENRNGARRWRSDFILANEKDFKSLGVQWKSMKSFLLQSLVHSSSRSMRIDSWSVLRSWSCFIMRFAAVVNFSFDKFSTMAAKDAGQVTVVGLEVG